MTVVKKVPNARPPAGSAKIRPAGDPVPSWSLRMSRGSRAPVLPSLAGQDQVEVAELVPEVAFV
jgi:hypothetical protein